MTDIFSESIGNTKNQLLQLLENKKLLETQLKLTNKSIENKRGRIEILQETKKNYEEAENKRILEEKQLEAEALQQEADELMEETEPGNKTSVDDGIVDHE